MRNTALLACLLLLGGICEADDDETLARTAADRLKPLLEDRDRGVRYAAAMALGKAGELEALAPVLDDPEWCVRSEARWWKAGGAKPALLPPHVPARFPPDQREPSGSVAVIAAGLIDPVYPKREAAFETLLTFGPVVAVPTAEMMATGDYGALSHGLRIFDQLGEAGAPAVDMLIPMLHSSDPNVREIAAHALRYIGPPARAAVPALVKKLGDRRLSVVNHAALALGRIGLSKELLEALGDERARVRAYAAFAIGWALGERRGIDQVAFEVRLPVLHVDGPVDKVPSMEAVVAAVDDESQVQVLRDGIWASDPGVAVLAAAAIDETQIDEVEAERVMELTLPEAMHPDSPVDFDRLRSIVGSSELGALISYVVHAEKVKPERKYLYSHLHRIVRAEHMPVLWWFERHFPGERFGETSSDIWIASGYTAAHARARTAYRLGRDPGPTRADVLRASVRDTLEAEDVDWQWELGLPDRWLVNEHTPSADDVSLYLDLAHRLIEDGGARSTAHGTLFGVLRMFGRLDDDESFAFLQEVAHPDADLSNEARFVARASLACRGDRAAEIWLVEKSRVDQYALVALIDSLPEVAAAVLRVRLSDEELAADTLDLLEGWLDAATYIGATVTPAAFAGVEAVVREDQTVATNLIRTVGLVPGCQTTALAKRALDQLLEDAGALGEDDEDSDGTMLIPDTTAALLHSLAPETFLRVVEGLVGLDTEPYPLDEWASYMLLQLGEFTPAVANLLDYVEDVPVELLLRVRTPEAEAWLEEFERDPDTDREMRRRALVVLARFWGWPDDKPFDVYDITTEEWWGDVEAAIRARDWTRLETVMQGAGARPGRAGVGVPWADDDESAVWVDLARRGIDGDAEARAALWSALRAGRYRWIHYVFDAELHSLGWDWSTWPHWVSDLESNCCRVSDGLADGLFETPFPMHDDLWGAQSSGLGQSLANRVRMWHTLMGGRWQRSPMLEPYEFVRAP